MLKQKVTIKTMPSGGGGTSFAIVSAKVMNGFESASTAGNEFGGLMNE
jgi:hypothetical protein